MPLAQALADCMASVTRAIDLIGAVHATDQHGTPIWGVDHRALITEAAFLRIYLSWEAYLEKSFLHYVLGSPSLSGVTIQRFVSPRDELHAKGLLVGCGRFVDWSTPDVVRKLARLYLVDGHPYEQVLSAIHSDLMDLKTIRNATAHLLSTTAAPLDALATRRLGQPCIGITVSEFILAIDPDSGNGDTILQSYTTLLTAAATQIANA